MEHPPDRHAQTVERAPRPTLGEDADADDNPRLQRLDRPSQRPVAGHKKRRLLARRQPVRGQVRAALAEERQRAVVPDQESLEERRRRTEAPLRPTPDPAAADLASPGAKAQDRPPGMLIGRRFDAASNPQPVAYVSHFAERHAGLGHAPWPRVHSQQQHPARRGTCRAQVRMVRPARVDQGVVDLRDRRPELEPVDLARQFVRDRRQRRGRHRQVTRSATCGPSSSGPAAGVCRASRSAGAEAAPRSRSTSAPCSVQCAPERRP